MLLDHFGAETQSFHSIQFYTVNLQNFTSSGNTSALIVIFTSYGITTTKTKNR